MITTAGNTHHFWEPHDEVLVRLEKEKKKKTDFQCVLKRRSTTVTTVVSVCVCEECVTVQDIFLPLTQRPQGYNSHWGKGTFSVKLDTEKLLNVPVQ